MARGQSNGDYFPIEAPQPRCVNLTTKAVQHNVLSLHCILWCSRETWTQVPPSTGRYGESSLPVSPQIWRTGFVTVHTYKTEFTECWEGRVNSWEGCNTAGSVMRTVSPHGLTDIRAVYKVKRCPFVCGAGESLVERKLQSFDFQGKWKLTSEQRKGAGSLVDRVQL